MNYIVIKEFLDRFDNLRHCKVGESHIPPNDERADQLVEKGYIEPVDGNDTSDDGQLINLGGGYYELPNGEKVRGKDKALKALEALEALEALKIDGDDIGKQADES
ncbi:MAG: hypothetical protein NAG76_22555 [Candidatus Pristimantibacillus lignocellulolyticus]|uniref:Uncharacterized protein n=1 Tax=Candidatus Pristimantibacillus lignocellulolyticus TaxID=2994561 RepID=A0A9J6ZFK4_9BACL|nr:MAG: hypothetical protein NAG76_22555 [Candidatus Pristimantibacillus lignocellulolyticus]